VHLEEFARGHSFLHRIDPGIKLIAAAVWSCLLAASDNAPLLAGALAFGLLLCLAARPPLRALLARLAFANFFTAFLWLSLPFSMPGECVFTLGPLCASGRGIGLALLITLKCNAILAAMNALLGTSTIFALTAALRRLRFPEQLTNVFFFSFRYFQIIHAEHHRLREAMRARCFTTGTSLRCYAVHAWMMGILLARALDRAERTYEAMLCRGYSGRFRSFERFSAQREDLRFAALFFLACVLFLLLTWSASGIGLPPQGR
jgi:cobalt/nickel transport system permease protein